MSDPAAPIAALIAEAERIADIGVQRNDGYDYTVPASNLVEYSTTLRALTAALAEQSQQREAAEANAEQGWWAAVADSRRARAAESALATAHAAIEAALAVEDANLDSAYYVVVGKMRAALQPASAAHPTEPSGSWSDGYHTGYIEAAGPVLVEPTTDEPTNGSAS